MRTGGVIPVEKWRTEADIESGGLTTNGANPFPDEEMEKADCDCEGCTSGVGCLCSAKTLKALLTGPFSKKPGRCERPCRARDAESFDR